MPAAKILESANAYSSILEGVNEAITSAETAAETADELTQLSSNLKTKAEQARARTDNINSDAMETRRELNEDIIPGIERAMADVERVTQINKVAKQNDEQIGKFNN